MSKVEVVIRSRQLQPGTEVKTCERCDEKPSTHEVVCTDAKAMWARNFVVVCGPYHHQVCEECKGEVMRGG